jgi:hypothetical protein
MSILKIQKIFLPKPIIRYLRSDIQGFKTLNVFFKPFVQIASEKLFIS